MKLGRINSNGPDGHSARLVAVQPEQQCVIDLRTVERLRLERQGATRAAASRLAAALFPSSMAAAIALGDTFLNAARHALEYADGAGAYPLAGAHLLPPIDPPMVRDFTAFEQHVRNITQRMGQAFPEHFFQLPVYYKGNPTTLIAHEQEVPWPHYTAHMDYELEFAMVIGRAGRNLTPDNALAHLFGLTVFNDFSARDIQAQEMRSNLGPAKGKDFASAVGPWITTYDELDLTRLEMITRVNGEEWSRGSSSTLTWPVAELIAYASQGEALQPGELIGSGTVGFGSGAESGKRLQPGDVIEMEITGIGVLRNRMGQPEPPGWMPPLRGSAFDGA